MLKHPCTGGKPRQEHPVADGVGEAEEAALPQVQGAHRTADRKDDQAHRGEAPGEDEEHQGGSEADREGRLRQGLRHLHRGQVPGSRGQGGNSIASILTQRVLNGFQNTPKSVPNRSTPLVPVQKAK